MIGLESTNEEETGFSGGLTRVTPTGACRAPSICSSSLREGLLISKQRRHNTMMREATRTCWEITNERTHQTRYTFRFHHRRTQLCTTPAYVAGSVVPDSETARRRYELKSLSLSTSALYAGVTTWKTVGARRAYDTNQIGGTYSHFQLLWGSRLTFSLLSQKRATYGDWAGSSCETVNGRLVNAGVFTGIELTSVLSESECGYVSHIMSKRFPEQWPSSGSQSQSKAPLDVPGSHSAPVGCY